MEKEEGERGRGSLYSRAGADCVVGDPERANCVNGDPERTVLRRE